MSCLILILIVIVIVIAILSYSSSTIQQATYRTFTYYQTAGDLDSSGILATEYLVYRRVLDHPPRLGCDVRRKMNYELELKSRTGMWTRG